MATIRHLFLDLEDTVITPVMNGWFNTHMINVQKVRAFIAEYKPDSVHLFSFAIWNEAERTRFNLGTRPMLEKSLGITLSAVPTVDDEIIPVACKVMNLGNGSVDFQEMSNFWGKHETFRLNMRHMFKTAHQHGNEVEVALLDDAVINEEFYWPDLKVRGRILNIDTMPEPLSLDALKDFSYVENVSLQNGQLYFRYDTDDNTIKENETIAFLFEEELNELGFTLSERYIEHDCITGVVVCR